MMRKLLAGLCAGTICIAMLVAAACNPTPAEGDKPVKIKDGISITVEEQKTAAVDLSLYISIPEGLDYEYTATSSNRAVATVSVTENIATITAVAEGSATVTASVDEVSVEFSVTVSKKQVTPAPGNADKTALAAELASEVAEQGDYTDESFEAYTQKLQTAKAVNAKADATQSEVDTACNELKAAREGLTLRTPEEKADADKEFGLLVNASKELIVSDYVDDKNLSSLTYEVNAANSKVTVSNVENGKFTVTAGSDEAEETVSIIVKYKDSPVLTVTLNVTVAAEAVPVLKHEAVTADIDLYSVENKTDITLDFAKNIENIGGLDLTYNVTLNGGALTLDGTSYTYAYGTYTDTATTVVFVVTVSYNDNGENKQLSYNYTLNIVDTRAYRITNGGFDNGLDGWTLGNDRLGAISEDTHYWLNDPESAEGFAFGNDGKFFSAYAVDDEAAMGTLTSSEFKIGGSGYITYKLGAAKNADKVYLDIIEKDTGAILARYYNNLWQDRTDGVKSGCTLIEYKADLSAHIGKTVYIRISDNAINDYGLFFVDSFVTYYPEVPTVGNTAVAVSDAPANIYQLLNGGFESGLNGWTVVTTEGPENEIFGALGNADATWGDNRSYNNDGKFFQNMHEACKGYLTSTSFTVSENGWMSFKLGGNKAHSYVSVIDANTGVELARFVNENYVGAWPNNGWEMYSYKVNLIESGIAAGTEVRIKVVDDATEDYGVVVVDSFAVYSSDPGEGFQKINKVS
ncbi:MAG: Ig-like domain-containing protein [Clostridia bacterium]|nr:Ig-like domain-containing protein [Clostridia bacterium]